MPLEGRKPLKCVGLLYHPKIPQSRDLARELQQAIEGLGLSPWVVSAWDEAEIRRRIADLDLLVTLGGDGTILRAARIAAPYAVPILGVNFGRLGFLAEVEPEEALDKVPLVLNGEYWLEERMMLHAELFRDEERLGTYEALNDVFVGRGSVPKAVRLTICIDDDCLGTYVADGALVATPTGSTAYSLAAGGPIVAPQLRSLLFMPIMPHLALVRSLVLPPEARVRIQVSTDYDAVLTVDGQVNVDLLDGDSVEATASRHTIPFIRLQPRAHFYETLLERLR
ncbi:MAG: NAD(+)/NADH kinase [Anaerolineae bacterium]